MKHKDNKEYQTPAATFDNAVYNDALGKHTGLVLANVSERVQSLCNGRMDIVTNIGQGTTITLAILALWGRS